jgi:hypothetical protein
VVTKISDLGIPDSLMAAPTSPSTCEYSQHLSYFWSRDQARRGGAGQSYSVHPGTVEVPISCFESFECCILSPASATYVVVNCMVNVVFEKKTNLQPMFRIPQTGSQEFCLRQL